MNLCLAFCTQNQAATNLLITDTIRIYNWKSAFLAYNNCITFVLLTFTLRHFPSNTLFHLWYFPIISSQDSPHRAKLTACNKSINELSLTYSVKTYTTVTNVSVLKAEPWWAPTFLEKESDNSSSTETALLQPWCSGITLLTKYSGTSLCLKDQQKSKKNLFKIITPKNNRLFFRSKCFNNNNVSQ